MSMAVRGFSQARSNYSNTNYNPANNNVYNTEIDRRTNIAQPMANPTLIKNANYYKKGLPKGSESDINAQFEKGELVATFIFKTMEKNRPVYVFQYPNGMQAPVENLNNIVDENGYGVYANVNNSYNVNANPTASNDSWIKKYKFWGGKKSRKSKSKSKSKSMKKTKNNKYKKMRKTRKRY